MGLVRIESLRVFRFLERLLGWVDGIKFAPQGVRAEITKFVGKNEEFTMSDAEIIIMSLGYEKTPVYLRNVMFRAGMGSWVNFADRLNKAGSVEYLAWEVRFLSRPAAQAILEYGLQQGLLQVYK